MNHKDQLFCWRCYFETGTFWEAYLKDRRLCCIYCGQYRAAKPKAWLLRWVRPRQNKS